MTVIDVSTLSKWADPVSSKLSMEYCEKYSTNVKIELVCDDSDAEKFINIILVKARIGQKGDGKIFVSDIADAIRIRTKKHGSDAI